MYKIIDTHSHIYPDAIAQKASDGTGKFYNIKMQNDGTVSRLLELSDIAKIDHHIVQSVATTPKQVSKINNFICETVKQYPDKFTGLGTMHPESENLEGDFNELCELGLKGIKLHPDIQGFKLDDPRCMKIYELCNKKKIPVLLHCGDFRYDYSNPNRLKPVLSAFPDLTFIGAHFAGWSMWSKAWRELFSYKNLFVDCSSSFYSMSVSTAREIIDGYSTDKVMFAVDYPMWNPKTELDFFMSLGYGESDNQRMLHDNACRIFKINI